MKKLWSLFLAVLLMVVLTVPAWADGGHGHGNQHGPASWDAPGPASWSWNGPAAWGPNEPSWGHWQGPGWWANWLRRFRHDRNNRGELGLGLASGIGPSGQADSRISVVPPGGSSQQAVICSNLPSGWAAPIAHSNWISLQADCTTGLAAGATYVYTTTFNLNNQRPNLSISGNVQADDSVTIQLNGNTIFTGGGFTTATPFSSNNAAFFANGANTLTFSVYNAGGPSGLDFSASVQAGQQRAPRVRDTDNDGD
ncbi:MAG: hypothetical protein ACRDIY_04235 [Chloroflexota bacterium]